MKGFATFVMALACRIGTFAYLLLADHPPTMESEVSKLVEPFAKARVIAEERDRGFWKRLPPE